MAIITLRSSTQENFWQEQQKLLPLVLRLTGRHKTDVAIP